MVIRRTKADQKGTANANSWMLGQLGLINYNEGPGLRTTTLDGGPASGQHSQPSYGMRGDNQIWDFYRLDHVSANVWSIAEVGSGTQLTVQDEKYGVAKFINGSADNNNQSYFSLYEPAMITLDRRTTVHSYIRVNDVDQADMFFGMCERLGSGNIFDNRVNSIGFYLTDGSAALNAENRSAGSATPSLDLGTMADDTWIELGIESAQVVSDAGTYTRSIFFINNYEVGRIELTLPSDVAMCITFGLRNGQAVANEMSVRQISLMQD